MINGINFANNFSSKKFTTNRDDQYLETFHNKKDKIMEILKPNKAINPLPVTSTFTKRKKSSMTNDKLTRILESAKTTETQINFQNTSKNQEAIKRFKNKFCL